MAMRKKFDSVARRIPVARTYLAKQALQHSIGKQREEIQGLYEAVARLEARNDEWAAEVSELRGDGKPLTILWPVTPEDLIKADYRQPPTPIKLKKHQPPYTINWVLPPVGSVSGGHAVIFRLIQLLEAKGHTCRIYFYDNLKQQSLQTTKQNMKHHAAVKAEVFYNEVDMAACDAIFATGWTTAYPVYNYTGQAKKFYLLQDYEPMFEPSGTYAALADNTYKLNLHGVSTSPWVADKVRREYHMACDELSLGITTSEYFLKNTGSRPKILFYARPVTPRRGFELGVLAIEQFHKAHPEFEIHFVGWDIARYEIPFPYVNHGILTTTELNDLFNDCVTGLVMSFTSMSLLPVEMMASGCVPVVNKAPCNTMVHYAQHIKYAEPNPQALADALYEAATPKDVSKQASVTAAYATQFTWDTYADQLDRVLQQNLSSER